MEAVTVRGLEKGFHLGVRGEIRWNGGMLGVAGFRTPNRGEGMQGRKVCLYLQGSNFRVP